MKLFDIRSGVLTVLVAGIFTANLTVIATAASYIHDLDCNMLSLALAVLSVYLWKRYEKGFLYGMLPLCLSIGLYQSYISVAITLVILYLVMELLDGEPFCAVFQKGLKSIAMIIGAGVLYFIALKIICYVTDVSIKSGRYNSIDTVLSMSIPRILYRVIEGYIRSCDEILHAASVYPEKVILLVHVLMIAVSGGIILCRVLQKEIKIKEKLLTLVLIVLLPLGMNIVYPITDGRSHVLMEFGFWLTYLFTLLIAWWAVRHFGAWKPLLKHGQRFAAVCLVLLVLWGNVQTANAAYLKKDLEQQANLSLFTRIVYQMERCDGYVTGETPVVFVGTPVALLDTVPGLEEIQDIIGCESPLTLFRNVRARYRAYFDYILLNPAVMADTEIWTKLQSDSTVAQMPCYPQEGCMAIIDGILVVKLGE